MPKNEIIDDIILDTSDCWIRFGNSYQKKKYVFKQPVFGKSNTDQSYYEPRSNSIANLYKSAGNSEKMPMYDFNDELPKNGDSIDVEKATKKLKTEHDKARKVSVLRGNKGADVAEISQLEREAREDVELSMTEQNQRISEMNKQMAFVDQVKSRLDNTTQNTSENV